FGESTADMAWDGHGLIAERGEMVAETARFALSGTSAVVDVDLLALREDRLRQGSWGENAAHFGRELRSVTVGAGEDRRTARVFHTLRRRVDPHPFVPAD